MKAITTYHQPDVVLLYQDHEIVEPVIQQILPFKTTILKVIYLILKNYTILRI